jgi:hypothetical protein
MRVSLFCCARKCLLTAPSLAYRYTSALSYNSITLKYDIGIRATTQTVMVGTPPNQQQETKSFVLWDNCGTSDEGKKACASGKAAVAFSAFMFIFGIANAFALSVGEMPGEVEVQSLMADDYAQAKLLAVATSIGLTVSSLITVGCGLGGLADIVDLLNKNPAYDFGIGIAGILAIVHVPFSLGCAGICYWWSTGEMPKDEMEETERAAIYEQRAKNGQATPGAATTDTAMVAPAAAPAEAAPAEAAPAEAAPAEAAP